MSGGFGRIADELSVIANPLSAACAVVMRGLVLLTVPLTDHTKIHDVTGRSAGLDISVPRNALSSGNGRTGWMVHTRRKLADYAESVPISR